MFGRSVITLLVILACLMGLAAPVLVDARHWWQRTAKKEKNLDLGYEGEMSMNEPVQCIRCHAHMEVGFVPDSNHSGCQQQNWSPGKTRTDFWTGLKLKADSLVPVTTLRCPKCGYLESYAIPRNISDK